MTWGSIETVMVVNVSRVVDAAVVVVVVVHGMRTRAITLDGSSIFITRVPG